MLTKLEVAYLICMTMCLLNFSMVCKFWFVGFQEYFEALLSDIPFWGVKAKLKTDNFWPLLLKVININF